MKPSQSAAEEVKRLQLDAIIEEVELVEMYARHASNYASVDDGLALDYVLRCIVACVKTTLETWRDLRGIGQPASESEGA